MKISLAEARAYAITAQQLVGPREQKADRKAVRALVDKLGVVQIDSVNVLVRSHYLPIFSRLGPYDPADLDRLAHRAPRALFEYWGHEASLLPVELQPLFRWRMARAKHHAWGHIKRMITDKPEVVAQVFAAVRDKAPISAGEVEVGAPKAKKGWWEWSDAKSAIEWLFWSGEVTSASRRGFERLYDLPERVLPKRVIETPTPSDADAHIALIERSARALGIGTINDLRDYYRLKPGDAKPAVAALVEQGVLVPITVEGWKQPTYRHRAARAVKPPRDRGALLSPFDSLIWMRERTERLFGMKFRLEIYTPGHKRVPGFYVLPFLLGDALVARVDLKADRKASLLRVQASHAEPHADKRRTAVALADELARMARWLGLAGVAVERRGDLARELRRC